MKTIKIKNSSKEYTIGKMVCVGRNYAEHAKELGNEVPKKPVIFLKPASVVIYSGDKIVKPSFGNDLHHEVELVLLMGKSVKDVKRKDAEDAILGYGLGLDMTLRDVQNQLRQNGDPWTISKCFDTSAVLSEFVLKEDYKLNLNEEISLLVNGTVRQKDLLNKMIFNPTQIVEYISSLMTMEEGDLIFTGTPKGVSKVVSGDVLDAELTGIGKLNCSVA